MLKVFIPSMALLMALLLSACSQKSEEPTAEQQDQAVQTDSTVEEPATPAIEETTSDDDLLAAVLASQNEELQARYQYRHPQETLSFFGIKPGMTVVEALPGEGWYSKILLPYLGGEGKLIAVDYEWEMWPKFGFFKEDFIQERKNWVNDWPEKAEDWRSENSASLSAFVFGSLGEELKGKADAALLIRALHNLNRFENDGGYLTTGLQDIYDVLKPGGIVGVVQHQAADEIPDEWADGSRGYLKKDALIKNMEKAGFEFVESIDINANPKDKPGEQDIVWRLPPTLFKTKEDPELKAKMEAIGESNRMTLKFRKPLS